MKRTDVPITFIASKESFADSMKNLTNEDLDTPISLDIEASSLDPFTGILILLQIGTDEWINIYDVRSLPEDNARYIAKQLENRKVISHNAKFEIKYIYEKYGIMLKNVHDTMLAESILFAGVGKPFTSLGELVDKYCAVYLDKDIREVFVDNPDVKITPEIAAYAANDVRYLPEIYREQMDAMKTKKSMAVYDLEMRLLPIVAEMEHRGVTLNKEKWGELAKRAKERALELRKEISDEIRSMVRSTCEHQQFENGKDMLDFFNVTLTGENKKVAYSREYLSEVKDVDTMVKVFSENFNSNSNPQMLRIFNLMGIPAESTNAKYLMRDFGDKAFAKKLVEMREWVKKATSFGVNFYEHINSKTGKIHSNYDQLATATGRFASSGPNLQNILRDAEYRHCFEAEDGFVLVTADYSQIELRLAAELAQEERMLSAFRNKVDLHQQTASDVFEIPFEDVDEETRVKGKSVNFAILYGTSAKGLAYNFQIPHSEGLKILQRHEENYPALHNFITVFRTMLLRTAFAKTPFGRRRYFTIPRRWTIRDTKLKFKVWREGYNHVIQGGSADMIKIALLSIANENPFGDLLRAVMTVHDEIVYEVHESILEEGTEFVLKHMTLAGQTFIKSIPVEVGHKVAKYWEK